MLNTIHEIEDEMKSIYNGEKDVTSEFISKLQSFLLMDNGEINTERCSMLINNSELKLVHKKVQLLDRMETVFGIRYRNIGVEIAPLK